MAILVLAMFTTFFVVERFTQKPASEYELQTAPRPEGIVRTAQPVVASYEVPEQSRLHHIRTRIDRRQAERRRQGSQPAA